ncbi:hypothetical protein WMY93_011751 [Mugilogobius chulae]|uniref:Uncharacterized protein n=1 Tax=Mugilogobius chulae TaxID=88201 RepID=A0AAW0P4U5_9GOBI
MWVRVIAVGLGKNLTRRHSRGDRRIMSLTKSAPELNKGEEGSPRQEDKREERGLWGAKGLQRIALTFTHKPHLSGVLNVKGGCSYGRDSWSSTLLHVSGPSSASHTDSPDFILFASLILFAVYSSQDRSNLGGP